MSEKEKQRRRGHNMGETGPSPKWPTSNVCITGLPVSAWRALDTLPSQEVQGTGDGGGKVLQGQI